MKEFILPEKWYLLFEDRTQFEICRDYFNTSWCFTGGGGCHNGSFWNSYMNSRHDINIIETKGFKRITFDQFKQYVLKQKPEKMKKQDFTIEGSLALKKAFIEECGVEIQDKECPSEGPEYFITPCRLSENLGKFTFKKTTSLKHFNLNTQYGEALEYVKEYFKPEEPEFKVGDLVVVLSNVQNSREKKYTNSSKIKEGEMYKIRLNDGECMGVNGLFWIVLEGFDNAISSNQLRHATPEEIEDYNNPKLPKVNGYEGKVVDKMIVYGNNCAKLPTKWFKDTFGATRHIKSMVLSSGVEINEEQMNQIRKVVNAKTK